MYMKSKEKIERLAEKEYPLKVVSVMEGYEDMNRFERGAYKKGYIQCQEDMKKELYEFGKLILDTFHSEGKTKSGKERLARIKFDEWFNELGK